MENVTGWGAANAAKQDGNESGLTSVVMAIVAPQARRHIVAIHSLPYNKRILSVNGTKKR